MGPMLGYGYRLLLPNDIHMREILLRMHNEINLKIMAEATFARGHWINLPYIDGLVQERQNSTAKALELCYRWVSARKT